MEREIRKVVVLGAGTMGAQVAAHLAGCGLDVSLLDILPEGGGDRSALARRALAGLRAVKPPPLHRPEDARHVRPGNFADDWGEIESADWVFEAVVEDLEIKHAVLKDVEPAARPQTVVTTNTSGLGVARMADGRSESFRRRFFGTHFFNPPRYMHLLETVPAPDTDPEVLEAMEAFCDRVLGKGVVRCKDTPNFIANRIGSYAFGAAFQAMVEMDLTVEEVDLLTGPAIGRAKSATFRTADLAGVDIAYRVSSNLYDAVPEDPERSVFLMPEFVGRMVERGLLGAKSGAGFYKKERGEILTLDWKTLEYRERRKPRCASLEAAGAVDDPAQRIRRIVSGKDAGAEFLRRVLTATSLYAASLVPEIADDIVSIDRAMEWGYAWGLGPFKTLDALGVDAVARRRREEGRGVPPLVERLLETGRESFYDTWDGRTVVFTGSGADPVPERPGVIEVGALKLAGRVHQHRDGASLVDLGDGVALVEFHTKMNTLGGDAIATLETAAREARSHFDAVVIGNQGEHFSAGANLMLVLVAAEEQDWDEVDRMVRHFQSANQALKYAPIPVVAAPFGLTLGGGCEVCLHADRVRAGAETYMGLVEVGVGLVPAAGGTKEMTLRALDRCAGVETDPFPFVERAFETIGFARISSSGTEALRMFLRAGDAITPNPDRLIADAKETALGLVRAGYRPARPRSDIPVLGRSPLATFRMGIHNAARGGRISEHDALIGRKLAAILCGGEDREPGVADEQHFLDLEREAFLSLLGTKPTHERIQHMLKTGKPLRN